MTNDPLSARAPAVPDDVSAMAARVRKWGGCDELADTIETQHAEIARLLRVKRDLTDYAAAVERAADKADAAIRPLRAALRDALAWIDAVPSDTPLPTMPGFDRDAVDALLDAHTAAQPAQCCMCGKTGLSTVEGDGGPECELSDGRWTCSRECWDRATAQPAPDAVAEADAWRDVLAERQRQISVEGWTPDHDDCHDRSELAQAAACYALSGTPADEAVFIHGRWKDPRDLFWPWSWDRSWWKPTDRRRDLVKAGALILAEIERLDRAAKGPSA